MEFTALSKAWVSWIKSWNEAYCRPPPLLDEMLHYMAFWTGTDRSHLENQTQWVINRSIVRPLLYVGFWMCCVVLRVLDSLEWSGIHWTILMQIKVSCDHCRLKGDRKAIHTKRPLLESIFDYWLIPKSKIWLMLDKYNVLLRNDDVNFSLLHWRIYGNGLNTMPWKTYTSQKSTIAILLQTMTRSSWLMAIIVALALQESDKSEQIQVIFFTYTINTWQDFNSLKWHCLTLLGLLRSIYWIGSFNRREK